VTDERQPVPDWADMIAERDAEIARLRAEVERLRTALAGITALFAAHCQSDPRKFDTYNEARAALNKEPRT